LGFFEHFQELNIPSLQNTIASATPDLVERVLTKDRIEPRDFPALLSPAAAPYIEELAARSAAITERRFGKVIQLYAPLYLSNECVNHCLYCGFSRENKIARQTLSPKNAAREAGILYDEGFRHILLVSGESPKQIGYHYLTAIIGDLHKRFDSISLEIYPLDTDGYARMGEAGIDGLTLYQETYDTKLYATLHPKGPKRDFAARIDAQDRAGQAGYRSLGIGALLGLSDWRTEALMVAIHGRYLTQKYWQSRIAVSFPRIRFAPAGFTPTCPVTDKEVVQMMCAMRLILPDCEMVVSTRELPEFRDNLIGLGVTRMSAGSKTSPGGYQNDQNAGEQFPVVDDRSANQIAQTIESKNHEPVWKDFDKELS
jgi:2-iminoacetate synthase